MPRTIAFTSCMDTVNYPQQTGWQHLAAQEFDTLVLLGDSIYMDYGRWPGHHNRSKDEGNGTPRSLPLDQFSARMHARYKAQFELQSFHDVVIDPRLKEIHAIWDDHDFAWNNSRGAGDSSDELVPDKTRRLSRGLFGLWLQALADRLPSYPPNPFPSGDVPEDEGKKSIARSVALAGAPAVLHLTDGRTFREQKHGSLLGDEQRSLLTDWFRRKDLVHIVASGSDLDTWSDYGDIEWLKAQASDTRIIVLSGDIHRPKFRDQEIGRLFEVTASAMAQGPTWGPKRDEVFGLVSVDESVVDVQLFAGPDMYKHKRIDIQRWVAL